MTGCIFNTVVICLIINVVSIFSVCTTFHFPCGMDESLELRWDFVFVQETWYWPGSVNADAVVMSGVRCAGTEMSLSHCLHHGEYLSCPKGGGRFAAGVSCSESKYCHQNIQIPLFLYLCIDFQSSYYIYVFLLASTN